MGETAIKAAATPSPGPLFCAKRGSAAWPGAGVTLPDASAAPPSPASAAPVGTALQRGDIKSPLHKPWTLPAQGLAVFQGGGETARLSHYFLPRLLLAGKRVLMLDGANCADPRLLERLARQRGVPFAEFNRQIEIARAFTCFQLTELIARVPRFRADFPAEILIVTAFPDLYFDEDVRDWDARVAFEQALAHLRRWASPFTTRSAGLPPGTDDAGLKAASTVAMPPLTVALFSAAATFAPLPARRHFFARTCAAAAEVWKFEIDAGGKLGLTRASSHRVIG
ncbi:MAG: hypothetical protein LAP13_14835 [Acidobacteriia bacterium]|nr:hypothetical protein [Terriglobia bacterium]